MAVYGEKQRRPSIFIEIGEEAYKQNTVYCPWHEILSGRPTAKPDSSSVEGIKRLILDQKS
ncbi:MAG: hypothetical protein Hals2KO_20890 [Halioglobus sp.]